jgi:DNA repair protein RAD50
MQTKLRSEIAKTQREVENAESLTSEYQTTEGDIEEKRRRIERIHNDMAAAKYDERLAEKNNSIREMDLRRDALHAEMQTLNLQAQIRAKYEVKRDELKSKESELKNR